LNLYRDLVHKHGDHLDTSSKDFADGSVDHDSRTKRGLDEIDFLKNHP